MILDHVTGFSAALIAAFLWAWASIIFKRIGIEINPFMLNLLKGVITILLYAAFILFLGLYETELHLHAYLLLFISGAIGIGVGDTAFFAALNTIGEQKTLIIAETIAPIFTLLFARIFLNENLTLWALFAVGVVVTGVVITLYERKAISAKDYHLRLKGIFFGLVAAFSQAAGAVLTKAAFSFQAMDPMFSSALRLSGGIFSLLIIIPVMRIPFKIPSLKEVVLWRALLLATLIGTFGGLYFHQVAFKFTFATIAQALIATSPVAALLIVFFKGEKILLKNWLGAATAVCGVALLFWLVSA